MGRWLPPAAGEGQPGGKNRTGTQRTPNADRQVLTVRHMMDSSRPHKPRGMTLADAGLTSHCESRGAVVQRTVLDSCH